MPEIPDFNVPYYNKPLSELRQEWWDHLQQPEVRITQAMDSRHKAKFKGGFFSKQVLFDSSKVAFGCAIIDLAVYS